MISGKAVARAVRCHLLIEGALMIKLLHMILPSTDVEETESLTEKPSAVTNLQLSEMGSVFEKVQEDHLSVKDCSILESEGLIMLSDCLTQLITAERTGSWQMHLQAVHDMLNLFTAMGPNNYAKSSHLYLQMMCNLETSHP